MAADVKEQKFIEEILRKATLLITAQEELHSAVDIFDDRGYSSSLEEEDCATYGITKTQLTSIANFVENFDLFLDGESVMAKDQRKVLNILRIDK